MFKIYDAWKLHQTANWSFDYSMTVQKIQVHDGWKPGAVSKRLLHMLNKAKSRRFAVQEIKRTRRMKKLVEDKPTLKISKKDGQYCIELQPNTDNPEEPTNQYTPLIYKIESENNNTKLKKKARLRRELTRAAVKEVWSNAYHSDNCEMTCLKAYNDAIGVSPLYENDNVNEEEVDTTDGSFGDEEISSSCSSSEEDWEMYFTPPIIRYQATQRDAASLSVM